MKKGQLLIGSVVGTIQKDFSQTDYYDDFAHTAALAESSGVKVIEFNLSCPNVASEGILCYTPEAVAEIASRIRKKYQSRSSQKWAILQTINKNCLKK